VAERWVRSVNTLAVFNVLAGLADPAASKLGDEIVDRTYLLTHRTNTRVVLIPLVIAYGFRTILYHIKGCVTGDVEMVVLPAVRTAHAGYAAAAYLINCR
jgi:hypothetical protein